MSSTWLYSMGIVLYWVHDASPGCEKTYRLIDLTAPLAERVDEVAEPDLRSEQEHQRQADGQPPGGRGHIAGRPDHYPDRDAEPGREQQADRGHMPGWPERGEQVPGQQAFGRGLVAGD